jgi:hypothetical protein
MSSKLKLLPALCACAVLCATSYVGAAVIHVETSRTTWNDLLDGGAPANIETMQGNNSGPTNPDTLLVTGTGISWVPSDAANQPPTIITGGDNYLTAAIGPGGLGEATSITFTFPNPVNAWGADFVNASTSGQILIGTGDGMSNQISVESELGGPGTGFLGVITDEFFTSITFLPENVEDQAEVIDELDNLSFGVDSDSLPSIPEPSTLALIALALLSYGVRRRRRR